MVAKQAYLSQIGRFWFPSGLGASGSKTSLSESDRPFLVSHAVWAQVVAKQAYLSQIGRFWFPSGLGTSGSKTSLSESDRSFLVSQRFGHKW